MPSGADRDGILIHELTHQADNLWYKITQNPAWTTAIQKVEDSILTKENVVSTWFSSEGKYYGDAFLSDIVSALSKGKIDTLFSHSRKYWERPGNREREIFANITALDILIGIDNIPAELGLKPLLELFKEFVSGGILP